MTGSALTLILAAAVTHATWNFLNKHAGGHATFTWLVAVLSALLYAPAAITIIEVWRIQIDFITVGIVAGSAEERCEPRRQRIIDQKLQTEYGTGSSRSRTEAAA